MAEGFWKKVGDSDLVKFLGVVGTVAGVAKFLVDLFADDDTEKILRRIDDLERAIEQGLAAIGDLINRQTEIMHQEFNVHDSETALANAFSAAGLIFTYKDLGLQDAIVEADGWSGNAVGLMLAQPLDPFFIGGLIGAGNVRIDVIRALDPEFYLEPFRVGEIFDLADRLETLINIVKGRVSRNHTIFHRQAPIEGELEPPAIRPGQRPRGPTHWVMEHRSHEVVIDQFESGPPGSAWAAAVRGHAEAARLRGVQAELEALGVPQFEQVVALWRSIPEQHRLQATMRKFVPRPRQRFDLDMARRPRFYVKATRRAALRAPSEGETVDGPAHFAPTRRLPGQPQLSFWELSADVRPFLVDLVTSPGCRKAFIAADAAPHDVVAALVSRILERHAGADESNLLLQMFEYLGFNGFVAALVYGKEYERQLRGRALSR